MDFVILLAVGAAFTAFAAFVFTVLTLGLGMVWSDFEVSGPDNWSFGDFYLRYLIIAAVFTVVTLPLYGFLGIAALAMAYKYVFDAGWTQALVMGIGGGIIAIVLFAILMFVVLPAFGLALL